MSGGWFSLEWPESGCPAAAPRALLSLAALGDMPVKPRPAENTRARIAGVFPGKRFVWLGQEHTRIVLCADPARDVCGLPGDGLVSHDPETVIGVTVADCLPVFLWDTVSGGRAVLHSGWKGTGIVREAVRLMKKLYGSRPAALRAILGPGIHSCCYAVPPPRAEAFAAEFGPDAAFFLGGAWRLDLYAANKKLLADEGVESVRANAECTCCDERFSSYRRQGKAFTRMLALCG